MRLLPHFILIPIKSRNHSEILICLASAINKMAAVNYNYGESTS